MLLLQPLLSVSDDDHQRPFSRLALDGISGPGQASPLRLDHLKRFCLQGVFQRVDLNDLGWVFRFGEDEGAGFKRELGLATYPEGAFGNADSSPGDGQGVFERGGRRVGAGVNAVAFALHLHLHREPLRVLGPPKTSMSATETQTRERKSEGVAAFLHLT